MKHALVVEDDPQVRTLTQWILESEGFHVELAENGKVALDILLDQPPPDIILLDINMPVMDGSEFLEKISKEDKIKKIPLVLVSADVERQSFFFSEV